MEINNIKTMILAITGTLGALISQAFGGWDSAMTTLLIFMATDYITGLIVAGVFKKSKKSQNGLLESKAGFKGLCKKGVMLLIVLIAIRLDLMLGIQYIKTGAIIAFCSNELISLIENAGLMGVWIPPVINKAIDMLQEKTEQGDV